MDDVIYLELDEEIPSVIDKLRNIEGKSIALVIPKGAAVLQSVVNLKILKNQAENLNKEIALVTQDKIGRNLASQVGLSVYDNIQSPRPILQPTRPEPDINETIELDLSVKKPDKPPAGISVHHYYEEKTQERSPIDRARMFGLSQFKKPELINNDISNKIEPTNQIAGRSQIVGNYQIPRDTRPSRLNNNKRKIKIWILLIIFIVAPATFYLYYPKATVILSLQGELYQKDVTLTVDKKISKPDINRGAIPGELVIVEKESTQNFTATGSKDVGEKATGTIKATNGSGDQQAVTIGTEFRSTSGTVFLATEAVNVPPATASVDSAGNVVKKSGSANIKVEAKEAGDSYNISSSTFTVIGNSRLTAESTTDMSGGSSRKVTIVNQDDINNAKQTLTKQLTEQNLNELKSYADKQFVNSNAVTNGVVSSSVDKNVGDEQSNFNVTLKLKSQTLSFYETDYRQMIADELTKGLSSDKELLLSGSDELNSTYSEADYSTGLMNVSSVVKTQIVSKINFSEIISKIKGKSKNVALTDLKNISNINQAEIKLRPSWWWSIPKNVVVDKRVR